MLGLRLLLRLFLVDFPQLREHAFLAPREWWWKCEMRKARPTALAGRKIAWLFFGPPGTKAVGIWCRVCIVFDIVVTEDVSFPHLLWDAAADVDLVHLLVPFFW